MIEDQEHREHENAEECECRERKREDEWRCSDLQREESECRITEMQWQMEWMQQMFTEQSDAAASAREVTETRSN